MGNGDNEPSGAGLGEEQETIDIKYSASTAPAWALCFRRSHSGPALLPAPLGPRVEPTLHSRLHSGSPAYKAPSPLSRPALVSAHLIFLRAGQWCCCARGHRESVESLNRRSGVPTHRSPRLLMVQDGACDRICSSHHCITNHPKT